MTSDSKDSASEKTEEPSERQLLKSRKEGQVSRSRDLMIALHSLSVFLFLGFSDLASQVMSGVFGGAYPGSVPRPLSETLGNTDFQAGWLMDRLRDAFALFPELLVPVAMVVIPAVVAGALMSGPFIFSLKVIAPKAQRISPAEGIKRIFSSKGLAEVIRATVKTLLLGLCLFFIIRYHFVEIMALSQWPLRDATLRGLQILLSAGLSLSLTLLLIAVPDVLWQKHSFRKKQMTTRQQARENLKDEEGSRESRERMRRTQLQKASVVRKKMLDAVPGADIIITNPDHFAVALQYRPGEQRAPVLIARGVDFLADLIISLGRRAGKPVMIQPMLARALYYHTEVDQEIAPDLYNAVAKIMVYLYQLNRYRSGQSKHNPGPPVIRVPDKYQYLSEVTVDR
ncbi:flagellar biosynthesis protein FlhB [Endozoicomonas sp.]|uniref:EscU/YscU/HrcU family type III secretion system export apparatus switch protein n=1 Tax=Endozoicomonas sp. TaxID=1892382 RepID=UPI00383BE051